MKSMFLKKVWEWIFVQYPLCSRYFQNVKLSLDFVESLILLPPLQFYVKSDFGDFRRSKNVIFGNFRDSELWTLVNLGLESCSNWQKLKFRVSKIAKNDIFGPSEITKIGIFTQNRIGSKIIKFQQSQALTSHFENFWSIVVPNTHKSFHTKANQFLFFGETPTIIILVSQQIHVDFMIENFSGNENGFSKNGTKVWIRKKVPFLKNICILLHFLLKFFLHLRAISIIMPTWMEKILINGQRMPSRNCHQEVWLWWYEKSYTISLTRGLGQIPQCANFKIFLSLRFYVKSK